MTTIEGNSYWKEHLRNKAIDDAAETQYDKRRDTDFWAGDLTIGNMAMYMIHVLVATEHDSIDDLADQIMHVYQDTQGGVPGDMYCR